METITPPLTTEVTKAAANHLPNSQTATDKAVRFLIGGYDNAGKSTLACSLYRALAEKGVPTSLYELDRWSDTHEPILGLKDWSQRQKVLEVSVEDYARYAANFINHPGGIVLGDIEGRYQNPHIRCLKRSADYGILLTREPIAKDESTQWPQSQQGWEELFSELEVPLAVRAHSLIEGQTPPPDTIAVSGLERQLVPNHPAVQKLAGVIIDLSIEKGLGW